MSKLQALLFIPESLYGILEFFIRVQYIVLMNAINYTTLRKTLKMQLDKVYQDHEPLIITRKNDENVVMLSLEDYNSLIETQYLLSSENNAAHLMKSLASAYTGNSIAKELIEE